MYKHIRDSMSSDENREFEQGVWSKKVRQIQGHAKV